MRKWKNPSRVNSKTWTRSYATWRNIIRRFTNKKCKSFKYYEKVHIDPLILVDFDYFCSLVPVPKSKDAFIDRIDPTKGYVAGNLRWTNSRGNTLNRKLTNGFRRCVARRIRTLIESKGLFKSQVADRVGTSVRQVTKWTSGRVIPSGPSCEKLAGVLGCELSFLFRRWNYRTKG